MDLMASKGQFHTQFGGDDATPPIGGVTGNPDSHVSRSSFLVFRLFTSLTALPPLVETLPSTTLF
jgi:hypothetical protein